MNVSEFIGVNSNSIYIYLFGLFADFFNVFIYENVYVSMYVTYLHPYISLLLFWRNFIYISLF